MIELEERPAAPPPEPEKPSGKGAGDENFPVGSALISPALRPTVAAFYAFARAADDIADDSELSPVEKIARLDAFEAAIDGREGYGEGYAKAHRLREALLARGVTLEHPRALISAFRQDAVKPRYATWSELVDYCTRSANPVGRFLVDLHGEPAALYPASDALCSALQVLNHLQDCGKDLAAIDRVYLPQDWLEEAGSSIEDLKKPALTPGLRQVIDRCLTECEAWVAAARLLARGMRDARFAAEAHTIVALAARLAARLRREDPLAGRVKLSKGDFAAAALAGVGVALFARKPVQA